MSVFCLLCPSNNSDSCTKKKIIRITAKHLSYMHNCFRKECRVSNLLFHFNPNCWPLLLHLGYENALLKHSQCFPSLDCPMGFQLQSTLDISNSDISNSAKLEAAFWIKNTFWLLSPTIICRWRLFYKFKFELVKNSPINFEISRFYCITM